MILKSAFFLVLVLAAISQPARAAEQFKSLPRAQIQAAVNEYARAEGIPVVTVSAIVQERTALNVPRITRSSYVNIAAVAQAAPNYFKASAVTADGRSLLISVRELNGKFSVEN
jgi:hypothetical protein